MSFESLPEEILGQISRLTADACYFEAQYYRSVELGLDHDIWCEDWGLAPLASVNAQMRRICMPILFSRIILRAEEEEESSTDWVVEGFGRFRRLISERPHIAQHILSIILLPNERLLFYYCCSESYPNRCDPDMYIGSHLEQLLELTEMLALLPRLRSLPIQSLHPDLMRAVMEHGSINHVYLPEIPDLYPDSAAFEFGSASLARMYLDKLQIDCIDESLSLYTIPKLLFKLGANVQHLTLKASLAQPRLIPTLEHSRIKELMFSDVDGLNAELVADFAMSIAPLHPEICKFAFFPSSSAKVLSQRHAILPLLSGIISGAQRSKSSQRTLSSIARIYFYSIERMPGFAADLRDTHWKITSLFLECCIWPLSISFLHTIGSDVPYVRCLRLQPSLSRNTGKGTGYIYTDHLAEGMSAFKHIEHLELRDVRIQPSNDGPEDEWHEHQSMHSLCVALKENCPSLERVIFRVLATPWHYDFWEMNIRRQLLVDGVKIETWKLPGRELECA